MTYSTFELSMMRLLVLGLLFADRISSPLLLKFDDDGDELAMMMIMTLMMMMMMVVRIGLVHFKD